MTVSERLRTLDTHSFVAKEFRVYTTQGAILSLITLTTILYLIMMEIGYNFQTVVTERVHVNGTSSRGLEVEFDITLKHVPCNLLSIDANDPTGQVQSLHLDKSHHIWKHRMKWNEKKNRMYFFGKKEKLEPGSTLLKEAHYMEAVQERVEFEINNKNDDTADAEDESSSEEDDCGSCYGAGEDGECCNTCEDVKRAYQRKGWHLKDVATVKQCLHEAKKQGGDQDGEGCNVHGVIALDSGGGNFHLAPSREMADLKAGGMGSTDLNDFFAKLFMRAFEDWNVTHTVNKIRFGRTYPGHVHQLDKQTRTITDGHGMYQYYFKVRERERARKK